MFIENPLCIINIANVMFALADVRSWRILMRKQKPYTCMPLCGRRPHFAVNAVELMLVPLVSCSLFAEHFVDFSPENAFSSNAARTHNRSIVRSLARSHTGIGFSTGIYIYWAGKIRHATNYETCCWFFGRLLSSPHCSEPLWCF